MATAGAEIWYDWYGRKGKRAKTTADKCGIGYMGQQGQWKCGDGKSEKGGIERGRRGG